MRYLIFTLLLCLGFSQSSEAQVLKKFKQRVTKSAEESATQRMERKADEKIEKGLDEVFESNKNNQKKEARQNNNANRMPMRSSSSNIEPPASYSFDYKIKVEMHVEGEMDMSMDYLLNSKAKYYAMEMNQGVNMLMVTDAERGAMFQFMDMGATKMLMVEDFDFDEEDQSVIENTQINTLPKKQIMGYTCEGVELIYEDMHSKIYFTKEAPVNFTFFNDPQQYKNFDIPKEIEDIMNDDVLMLEMQVKDLREGYNVIWKAKSLDKHQHKVDTSKYQRM